MVKVRKKFNGTTEDRGRTTKKGNIRITLRYWKSYMHKKQFILLFVFHECCIKIKLTRFSFIISLELKTRTHIKIM